MFWAFLILVVIAWVQIGRGAWGNPEADLVERASLQTARAQDMLDRAAAATEQADIDRFNTLASNLQSTAGKTLEQANATQDQALGIMLTGITLLFVLKIVQGFCANAAYEKQYSNWRIDPDNTESGQTTRNSVMGAVLTALIGPLVVYQFTVSKSLNVLDEFPEDYSSGLLLGEGNGILYSAPATRPAFWPQSFLVCRQ